MSTTLSPATVALAPDRTPVVVIIAVLPISRPLCTRRRRVHTNPPPIASGRTLCLRHATARSDPDALDPPVLECRQSEDREDYGGQADAQEARPRWMALSGVMNHRT